MTSLRDCMCAFLDCRGHGPRFGWKAACLLKFCLSATPCAMWTAHAWKASATFGRRGTENGGVEVGKKSGKKCTEIYRNVRTRQSKNHEKRWDMNIVNQWRCCRLGNTLIFDLFITQPSKSCWLGLDWHLNHLVALVSMEPHAKGMQSQ